MLANFVSIFIKMKCNKQRNWDPGAHNTTPLIIKCARV